MDETFKKMLQKRVYDLLSHKYGILMLIAGAFLLALSAFHFGQAWLEWSQEKYEAVFNSFSDNIAGKSFRDRLSAPLPIDVVYTWVNGTDPDLIRQLELVKVSLDKKSNLSREEHCTYTNCLSVGIIIHPPLPSEAVLNDVIKADSIFHNVTDLKNIKEKIDGPANLTLLILDNEVEVKQIVKLKAGGWNFQGTNHTLKPAYYTSEGSLPHGLLVPDIVMMSGFPVHYGDGDIQQTVAGRLNVTDKASIVAKMYPEKGVALLQMFQSSHYELLIKGKNFTIEGKELRLSPVKIVWDLKFVVTDDVVAASRFEDNEELRYSLRSIEQFAPWVRHIFIVTNGQIPYWLNLDNPRLTIITHDEIFLNVSHLPTFSSPAIEANIHRIPGLSDKFLYLNDDVMFGSPVWPDDFFSHSTGQKLYLTWPVPNCNEGCPSTWIRDGYCDRACNSSECDWDGGDCLGLKGPVQLGAGFHGDHSRFLSDYVSYCATGCANNWLADKYCDQACNNFDCGYDIGDCGTDNYNQLYNLNLQLGQSHYVLPPGEMIAYFNLSELVGEKGKVKSANYETNSGLRAVAVGNKFRVMTMVLNKGVNATNLKFYLVYTKDGNDTHKINLTVLVDTSVSRPKPEVISTKNKTIKADVNIDDHLDAAAFQDGFVSQRGPITSDIKSPVLDKPLPDGIDAGILPVFSRVPMSDALRIQLEHLHESNKEGELTDFGVNVRLQKLMKHFGQELEALKLQFQEQKKKFAEEEEQRKLNEESKISHNVTDVVSVAGDKHNKQQMDEPSPNNILSRGNQPGLNPQLQVMQDFHHLGQQQQARLNDRQKRLVSNEILPQNDIYQADVPGKVPQNDIYQADVPGKVPQNAVNQAHIPGKVPQNAVYQAHIPGKVPQNDIYQADVPGKVPQNAVNQAHIPGKVPQNAVYQGDIPGKVPQNDIYQADVPGKVPQNDIYQADVPGKVPQNDIYQADVPGKVLQNAVNQAHIPGKVPQNDIYQADVPGKVPQNAINQAHIPGKVPQNAVNQAHIPGKVPQNAVYQGDVPGKVPQKAVNQAHIPEKETSLEKPQLKLQQGGIFHQMNPYRFNKSQLQQKSNDSVKSKIVTEASQKTKIRKSPAEFHPERLHPGRIDHKEAAGDSQQQGGFKVFEQDKSLAGVDIAGNDTRNKDTRTGRKLLAVMYWSDHVARLEEKQERARMKMKKDKLEDEMSDEDFLKLVSVDGAAEDLGGFPWEKKSGQERGEVSREKARRENEYIVEGWQGRQLLDTFGDSLRHVNRIYNKEFGIASRKVPGHMPHMIDKNVMQELQDRFPKEWDETSAHKIRSSTDMQYAFAYYYYLMGVTEEITVEQVFNLMDTDHSGVLSDREIRTLAARMYELPLYLETLTGLEAMFVNCSESVTDPTLQGLSDDQHEVYYDKSMPLVTKYLFLHCDELVQVVKSKFRPVAKYKTTIVNDDDIAFKMVHTNVSHVVGQLDDIRKHPKKFICLNDNIDHRKDEARTVKAILQDFYESLVPAPSQFELARDYRNRFLHMDELREWRLYRDRLRFWTHVALTVLVFLTILSFLGEKIENLRRKWTHRKRRHCQASSSNFDSTDSEVTSVSTPPASPEPPSPSHWQQNLIETV